MARVLHSVRPRPVAAAAAAVVTVLLSLHAPSALSQDDNRGSREREALRRTQAALRQAQEQQATTARERDDLAGQRDKADEAAKHAQAQLSASHADAARLNASLAQAGEELAATKARDESQRKELEAKLADLSRKLDDAQRVADERARANAALTGLLEHATQSLAVAEKANRDMHALGAQMIDRLRDGGAKPGVADPVLGFGQIRLENEAESLRDQLDAARIANVARSAGGAGAATK